MPSPRRDGASRSPRVGARRGSNAIEVMSVMFTRSLEHGGERVSPEPRAAFRIEQDGVRNRVRQRQEPQEPVPPLGVTLWPRLRAPVLLDPGVEHIDMVF